MWRHVDAVVHMPGLGSHDVQDHYVMFVVVGNETLRCGRSEVGVDLYREVQLHLDGVGQCSNRAHVALDAVQNDGVTIVKVGADPDKIEAAITQPVAVASLLVFFLYQPYCRWLLAKKLQKLIQRRRTRQEAIEVARRATFDGVARYSPYLVEKG